MDFSQNGVLLSSIFNFVNMSSVNGFLHRKLLLYAASLWASLSALFRFFNKSIFRVEGSHTINSNTSEPDSNFTETENSEQYSDCLEQEAEIDPNGTKESNVSDEEETPKFFFKFEYQISRDDHYPIVSDSDSSANINKYEFSFAKDSSLFAGSDDKVVEGKVEEPVIDEGEEKPANGSEVEEKVESEISIQKSNSGKDTEDYSENNLWIDHQIWGKHRQFSLDKGLITSEFGSSSDSDSDSIASSHELFNRVVASSSDGFFSEKDFEEAFQFIDLRNSEDLESGDLNSQNSSSGPDDVDEADSDILEELENLKGSEVQNSDSKDSTSGEDSNGLEILWEHQELIEQLKMELKKVRATGLPTIMEDDESPKMMEDLKPWKIDDKFHQKDTMGELHRFYRSYRERMRKFDIFNYQKMYAIGFLQSKDPLKSINWSSKASSVPALTSLLSIGKRKKHSSDPTMSFIRELHSDLEVVYVGQMCLSWEILHWQYQKALEIWDSDTHGIRRYNEVAGEFQQFQVLLQRFIENEPFEGPRIQYYVKSRCVLRNLLQVPVIREDSTKDKKGRRNRNDSEIKSDTLIEIIEESIRIFWGFVRADKDSHNVIQKSRKGTQIQPQDPTELELLTELRTSLLKKEKKLKEILRSGSCILRKFQKQKEESSSDQVLYFFSQVDMKLVARVLNMSKITADQLLWCRSKLDKISFGGRRIHVDQSFLLFPC